MNVELSLDIKNNSVEQDEEHSHPEDTQRMSGSQVASAFASIQQQKDKQSDSSRFTVLTLSMSVVFAIVALYLIFVLAR